MVRYALPQMIGLLFNSCYVLVDGIFIGRILGTTAMAAAGTAVLLVELLVALSMALSAGGSVGIMAHLAKGEQEKARRIFADVLALALLIGLLICLFGNLFLTELAMALGADASCLADAKTYLRFIVTFCPFMLMGYLLGGLTRADDCPKLAMTAMSVGSVSNIFLDFLFMVPLRMGIGGAALATAIGPVLPILILLPHFVLHKGTLYLTRMPGLFRSFFREAGRILYAGFPSFVMEYSIGIVTFFINRAIVRERFGSQGLAAFLIIGYLMLLYLTVFLGMAEGLQPVLSLLAGKKTSGDSGTFRRIPGRSFLSLASSFRFCVWVSHGRSIRSLMRRIRR